MESNEVAKVPPAMTMNDLMEIEAYDYQQPKRGDIRQGTLLSIGPNQIIVDIGVKREALVSPRDLEHMSTEDLEKLAVGDEIPVYIVKPEDKEGNLIVSIHLAQLEKDWRKAQELFKNHEIWEAQVSGYNKGGLIVPFGKIRAFVPASQISDFPRNLSPEQKASQLASYVEQSLPVRIIEVDRRRGRLILSQRSAQREWREKQKERLIKTLKEGDEIQGAVSSLADFGAFVDIGGVDGLIHVSELAWHRVKHPRELLKVGDEIKVYVLRIDFERKRIGLSLKRLQPDPWTLVDDKYNIDQFVECTITNVTDFGAFARLEEGVEGLIHVSELTDEENVHPSALVDPGAELLLTIIKIDARQQRIGLSLKRVPEEKRREWLAQRAALAEAEREEEISAEAETDIEASAELADVEEASAELADAEEASAELADAEEASAELADVEEASAELADAEEVSAELAGVEEVSAELADVEEASAELADAEEVSAELADVEEVSAELADVEAEVGEEIPNGEEKVETVAVGPDGAEAYD